MMYPISMYLNLSTDLVKVPIQIPKVHLAGIRPYIKKPEKK